MMKKNVSLGLMLLLLTLLFCSDELSFLWGINRDSTYKSAQVVYVSKDDFQPIMPIYIYIIKFTENDQNAVVSVTSKRKSSLLGNKPEIGDSIIVVYPSGFPDRARINSFQEKYGLIIISLSFCFVFYLGSVTIQMINKKNLI